MSEVVIGSIDSEWMGIFCVRFLGRPLGVGQIVSGQSRMSQIEKGKQRIVDEAKGQTIQAFTSEILKALSSLQLKAIVPNFDANPTSTGSDR